MYAYIMSGLKRQCPDKAVVGSRLPKHPHTDKHSEEEAEPGSSTPGTVHQNGIVNHGGNMDIHEGIKISNNHLAPHSSISNSFNTNNYANPDTLQSNPLGFVGVADRNPDFTGRRHELEAIDKLRDRGLRLAVIKGMAGAGKTSIALEYVHIRQKDYQNVIWIDAETKVSMLAKFKSLAKRVGVKAIDDPIREDIEEVYAKLYAYSTLVVFDNAERYLDKTKCFDGIQLYFPPPSRSSDPPCFTIITTRYAEKWGSLSKAADVIQLEYLNETDCKDLIRKLLDAMPRGIVTDFEEESWKKLAKYYSSCYLPITIESTLGFFQICAEMKKDEGKKYLISQFLDEFVICDNPKELKDPLQENTAHDRMKQMWNKSIAKMQTDFGKTGRLAVHILNVMSFLSPDGVMRNQLGRLLIQMRDFFSLETVCDHFAEAIRLLKAASLVTVSENPVSYKIHRTLIEYLLSDLNKSLDRLSSRPSTNSWNYLFYLIQVSRVICVNELKFLIGGGGDGFTESQLEALIKHILSLKRSLDDKLIQALYENMPFVDEIRKYVQKRKNENFCPVRHIYRPVYEKRITQGANDENIQEARERLVFNLARNSMSSILDAETNQEIIEIFQKDYDRQCLSFELDHCYRNTTRCSIAKYLARLGRDKAMDFLQPCFERQTAFLGPDAPVTLQTRNSYAEHCLSWEQGKDDTGFSFLQREYLRQSNITAMEHDNTKSRDTRTLIANCLSQAGYSSQSIQFLEDEYDTCLQNFGACHLKSHEIIDQIIRILDTSKLRSSGFSWPHALVIRIKESFKKHKEEVQLENYRTADTRCVYLRLAKAIPESVGKFEEILLEEYIRLQDLSGYNHVETLRLGNIIMAYNHLPSFIDDIISKLLAADYAWQQRNQGDQDTIRLLEHTLEITTPTILVKFKSMLDMYCATHYKSLSNVLANSREERPDVLRIMHVLLCQLFWGGNPLFPTLRYFDDSSVMTMLESDYRTCSKRFGSDSPTALALRNLICRLQVVAGGRLLWDTAFDYVKQDLKRQMKELKASDSKILDTSKTIADLYCEVGRSFDAAQFLCEEYNRGLGNCKGNDPYSLAISEMIATIVTKRPSF